MNFELCGWRHVFILLTQRVAAAVAETSTPPAWYWLHSVVGNDGCQGQDESIVQGVPGV